MRLRGKRGRMPKLKMNLVGMSSTATVHVREMEKTAQLPELVFGGVTKIQGLLPYALHSSDDPIWGQKYCRTVSW